MKRARAAEGDVKLYAPRAEVLRILLMTQLDKAMRVYPTRKAAVASWK